MANTGGTNNTLVIVIVILLMVGGFAAYKQGLFTEKHDVDITLPGGKKITADMKH